MEIRDLTDEIQRRIRWIPSWKKRKIAKIFKVSCCVLLAAILIGVGFLLMRRLSPKRDLPFPGSYSVAPVQPVNDQTESEMPPFSELNQIKGLRAEASSMLSGNQTVYSPEQAIDGNLQTSWQEGASGYGIGESITFLFDKNQPVSCMLIYGGSFRTEESFRENGRLKQYTVTFSDGTSYSYQAEDSFEPAAIWFDSPVKTDFVTLTIDDVYTGSKYEDTVISEVIFYKK